VDPRGVAGREAADGTAEPSQSRRLRAPSQRGGAVGCNNCYAAWRLSGLAASEVALSLH
jgi:hypothetical protein